MAHLLAFLLDPIFDRLQRRWPGADIRRWVGLGFYLLLGLFFPAVIGGLHTIFGSSPSP